MYIKVETTPNPKTLKFITNIDFGCEVEYKKISTDKTDFIKEFFLIDQIEGVFISNSNISITIDDQNDVEWAILKPQIISIIMDFKQSKKPFFLNKPKKQKYKPKNQEEQGILDIINERVAPAVAEDGGGIEFCGIDNGFVLVKLIGACSGCPSSTITLKEGVERLIKHFYPEIKGVKEFN